MDRFEISPMAFGLALGVFWGVSVLLLGIIAYIFSYGEGIVAIIGNMYIEYEVSILGSIFRGLIGFLDGFVTGLILAWLYNFFARHSAQKPKE